MKELTATEKDRCVELLRKLVDPEVEQVWDLIIAVDEHRGVVMETKGEASSVGRTLADQWIIAAMGQIQQECVSLNLYQGCE